MHFCSLPHLAIIDLSDTRVDPEGLSLLLACHPRLVTIVHVENFHSFHLIKTISSYAEQSYHLKHLSTHDIHISPDNYEYALEHCPHLESLSLTSTGLVNEHLYKLMTIKNLSSLHLGNKHWQNFNFYEGVAPVLDVIGVNLKKLVLEDFTEVDIDFIGDKCPRLQHLAMSNILTYGPSQLNSKYFTQLGSLEIWNKIGQDHELAVSQNVLMQLLCRAPLTYVLLQRIANLTDEVLMEVLSMNRLLELRNVVIDYCHNISGRFIWLLLEQPNELRVLRCWHNKGVEEDTKDQVQHVITDDNLMLYWEYYPYNEYEELLDAGQITLENEYEEEEEEEDDNDDEVVDN